MISLIEDTKHICCLDVKISYHFSMLVNWVTLISPLISILIYLPSINLPLPSSRSLRSYQSTNAEGQQFSEDTALPCAPDLFKWGTSTMEKPRGISNNWVDSWKQWLLKGLVPCHFLANSPTKYVPQRKKDCVFDRVAVGNWHILDAFWFIYWSAWSRYLATITWLSISWSTILPQIKFNYSHEP